MNIDVSLVAQWASGFIAIFTFAKLVVQPFTKSMRKNEETMKSLEQTISEINRDIKDSVKDMERMRGILEKHEHCIDAISKEQIKHGEQLKTLFNRSNSSPFH